MKIKITKLDGTVIEAEGTPEECRALVGDRDVKPANVQFVPFYVPTVPPTYPWDVTPSWQWTADTIASGTFADNPPTSSVWLTGGAS